MDGAVGYSVQSFLDAYSGYNQIRIHPRDKEKTTFMKEDSNYYYEVMLFGLKNVGATYQRLTDKVFEGLIGKNVEVYVDDIVVKSDSCNQHKVGLLEVLQALQKYNMRLNPDKCVFGIEGGKFLYAHTQRDRGKSQ